MGTLKVVVADAKFAEYEIERQTLAYTGATLEVHRCTSEDELVRAAPDADALLVHAMKIGASALKRLPKCRGIVRYGVGYDVIDIDAARELGIPVSNVPDYCTDEVADHALALILALGRRLPQVDSQVRAGRWEGAPCRPIHTLRSSTLGLLGVGRIGAAVVERAKPFGFRIIAHDPNATPEVFEAMDIERVSLDELLAMCDTLSLHLPLTSETRHVIDGKAIARMKPGSSLVNVSRGGLVDETAAAEALKRGHLSGVGLDVFEREPLEAEHPLLAVDGTILTSHCAWYSEEAFDELQRLAAEEVVRHLTGVPGHNVVNAA